MQALVEWLFRPFFSGPSKQQGRDVAHATVVKLNYRPKNQKKVFTLFQNRCWLILALKFFSALIPRLTASEWLVIPQPGQKSELAGNVLLQRKQVFGFDMLSPIGKRN